MKVGNYISELLMLGHESVVFPGFGEFYTKYHPAKFVPEEKKVQSPSRTIAFNQAIREGDEPLTGYLSEKEHMDVEHVKSYLSDYVSEISQLLKDGKKVELEKLGVFSAGKGDDIIFEPDLSVNYLAEASGIGAINVPPSNNPVPEESPLQKTKPQETPDSDIPAKPKTKPVYTTKEDITMENEKKAELPRALKWIAFTIVPLLVIIIILALNYKYFFSGRDKDKTVVQMEAPVPVSVPEETPAPAEMTGQPQADQQSPAQVTQPATQTVSSPQTTPAKPEAGRPVYYIVVGSFPVEAEAESLARSLREKGASLASVFMKTGFDYHRVCYGYYYDVKEAEALLPSVRESVNKDAYILHR